MEEAEERLLNRIAAGAPITAEQQLDDVLGRLGSGAGTAGAATHAV